MAEGRLVGVVGTAVGGTAVGGTGLATTGVFVTTTGVGGIVVLVGSTWMIPGVVGIVGAGAWLVAAGGLPLAGNLHAVEINARITNNRLM